MTDGSQIHVTPPLTSLIMIEMVTRMMMMSVSRNMTKMMLMMTMVTRMMLVSRNMTMMMLMMTMCDFSPSCNAAASLQGST